MTRQWTMRSRLGAMILLCMALGVAVQARQRGDTADLRDRLRERYDVLSLQDGIGLVPRARDAGIRIIEVRNGTVSVDGQALSGGEVRTRLGADADLILRITYLDAADQRQIVDPGTATPALQQAPAAPVTTRVRRGELSQVGDNVTVARDELVDGDVSVVFGNADIQGDVDGDVNVVMGNAVLGPQAAVRGDVNVVAGTIDRAPGARIGGAVHIVGAGDGRWRGAGFPRRLRDSIFGRVGSLAGTLFRVAFVTLLALVVVAFGRPSVERIADRASADPLRAGLAGFLGQLLFVPVLLMTVVVLAVSIVGIPLLLLIPFAILLVLLAGLVGFTGVASSVGSVLNARCGWAGRGPYATVLLGVVAIALVTLLARAAAVIGGGVLTFPIHVVGYLVEYVAWTLGFGAVVLVWLRERRERGGWGFHRHSPESSPET